MLTRSRAARVVALIVLSAALLQVDPAFAARSSRLEETKRQIAATRAKLRTAIRSDREVMAVLSAINGQLARQRAALAAAQRRLTRVDLAVRAQERRLSALDKRLRARKSVIDARARELYILGPMTEVDAIVGGKDTLEQYLGRAGVLEAVATFDRRLLQDMAAIRYQVEETHAALREKRAEAARARAEVAERVQTVAGYRAVQQEAHDRLQSNIRRLRAQLEAELREQARIERIIRSRGSVYTGGSGRLGFAWPIRGRITSPYGPRWGSYHTGIDIDCRTGQSIGASKAGRVIESGWGGGYGRMVIIDHGGGYASLYAHMSALYVGTGATVSQGQKVGACGASGNATGDHLHFEIRVNGNHRNPRPYLP